MECRMSGSDARLPAKDSLRKLVFEGNVHAAQSEKTWCVMRRALIRGRPGQVQGSGVEEKGGGSVVLRLFIKGRLLWIPSPD